MLRTMLRAMLRTMLGVLCDTLCKSRPNVEQNKWLSHLRIYHADRDTEKKLRLVHLQFLFICRLSVSENKESVRKILQDSEVQFMIEFRILDMEERRYMLVRKRYAIDLSPCRKRRWSSWIYSSVPQEWRFPDYNQHTCCGCWSGCGPVAWAQIFGYYDR